MPKAFPAAVRSQTDTSPEDGGGGRRVRRARSEPKLYICFLPEGKGGPRVDKGSVPIESDVEQHIEERSDCEPGLYRIEKKRSGEFSGDVLFYTKEDAVSRRVPLEREEEYDAIDFAPPDAGTSLTPAEDLARLVAASVNHALESRERKARAESKDPSALDLLREVEAMADRRVEQERARREEIRAEISAMLPPPAQPSTGEALLDDRTRLELAVVRETGLLPQIFREMKGLMNTADRADQPQSWIEKAWDFAKDSLPYVGPAVGPAIGAKLAALLNRVNDDALANAVNSRLAEKRIAEQQAQSALPPASQNSSPSQPESAGNEDPPLSLELVVGYIKDDIVANREPADSGESESTVDVVVRFLAEQPQFIQPMGELLAKTNAELVAFLSHATATNLSVLSNAEKFVDGLRTGVQSRLQMNVNPPSTNGTKASAESTVRAKKK